MRVVIVWNDRGPRGLMFDVDPEVPSEDCIVPGSSERVVFDGDLVVPEELQKWAGGVDWTASTIQ